MLFQSYNQPKEPVTPILVVDIRLDEGNEAGSGATCEHAGEEQVDLTSFEFPVDEKEDRCEGRVDDQPEEVGNEESGIGGHIKSI